MRLYTITYSDYDDWGVLGTFDCEADRDAAFAAIAAIPWHKTVSEFGTMWERRFSVGGVEQSEFTSDDHPEGRKNIRRGIIETHSGAVPVVDLTDRTPEEPKP